MCAIIYFHGKEHLFLKTSAQAVLFYAYRRQVMSKIKVLVAVPADAMLRSVFSKVTPLRYLKM